MRQKLEEAVAPDLARALDAIQLAAAERRRWPDALDAIVQFLGARFAALIFEDADRAMLELKYSTRAEKSWIIEYLRRHRHLDAVKARLLKSVGTGAVFSLHDFVSPARIRNSDEYTRWLAPHGLTDVVGAILHRSVGGACLFVALLDKAADVETRSRLAALTPNLSAAITGEAQTLDAAESMMELFDRLATPIIVVGDDMHIRFANLAAQEALQGKAGLSAIDDALVVNDPQAQEALEALVATHARSSPSNAVLVRDGSARCCVIHTLPLSGGATAIISGMLHAGLSDDISVAAGVYRLTVRERSVLLAIAEVGGVPATARALELSEGTVRGYLKSIFQKTGARRQAELVRLALALRSPFRSTGHTAEV